MEVKIKTLTSQHEDCFFVAKIIALDPHTGKEFMPSICAYSEPIKVISKPEQLKKRKTTKKRTLTDMLVETINRIERTQSEQSKMINQLLESRAGGGGGGQAAPLPFTGRTRDLLWADSSSGKVCVLLIACNKQRCMYILIMKLKHMFSIFSRTNFFVCTDHARRGSARNQQQ